jgi:hypothetical protein
LATYCTTSDPLWIASPTRSPAAAERLTLAA